MLFNVYSSGSHFHAFLAEETKNYHAICGMGCLGSESVYNGKSVMQDINMLIWFHIKQQIPLKKYFITIGNSLVALEGSHFTGLFIFKTAGVKCCVVAVKSIVIFVLVLRDQCLQYI